jgi:hypothetical protein
VQPESRGRRGRCNTVQRSTTRGVAAQSPARRAISGTRAFHIEPRAFPNTHSAAPRGRSPDETASMKTITTALLPHTQELRAPFVRTCNGTSDAREHDW